MAQQVTGGRNGYGAKLCNIFSTDFIVETLDRLASAMLHHACSRMCSERHLKYKQVFSSNMSVKGEPSISSTDKTEDFTRITFKPDLPRFGMDVLDRDTVALLTRRVYDIAGTCDKVKVYLNGTRLPIKSFKEYVDLVMKDDGSACICLQNVISHAPLQQRADAPHLAREGQ